MGSNLNFDTLYHHFVLDATELLLDVPKNDLTFHLYGDVITYNSVLVPFRDMVFNILKMELFVVDSNGNVHEIFTGALDLYLKDIVPSGFLFTGKVLTELSYSTNMVQNQKQLSSEFDIVTTYNNANNEIYNSPSKMYESLQTEWFNYTQLLSPQPIIFKVNFIQN
jgi:hypothetical protein